MNEKKEKTLYLPAILYIVAAYLLPVLYSVTESLVTLLIPAALGIVNLIITVHEKNNISREQFLNCSLLIKYSLIPFYIVGGLCILLSLFLAIIPVPFMIFLGGTFAIILSVLGWIILVGAAPYSICYIVKSCQQGIHGKALSIFAGILQFFFSVDVIAMMILALKEKKWVKTTIIILVLLLLAILCSIVGFAILIAKARTAA